MAALTGYHRTAAIRLPVRTTAVSRLEYASGHFINKANFSRLWRCLHPRSRKVVISREIRFSHTKFVSVKPKRVFFLHFYMWVDFSVDSVQ